MPCGGTTTVNLNSYNHNSSDAVYSLIPNGYDTGDFSAASITEAGVLSITAGTNYEPHGLHEIQYMVSKENGKYKDFESVWFCFDSPCTTGCTKCNTCSGECYGTPDQASVTVSCGDSGLTYDATTGLNTGSCDGTTVWTVTAPDAISPIISDSGMITYGINDIAVPGQTYSMAWKGVCSLYGMEVSGTLDVLVENKCIGVTCGGDQVCRPCTGDCEDLESDQGANGSAITSSGPSVSTS